MLKLGKLFAISSVALALGACDVDKTEQGDMPDVEVEGGEVPEYEVVKKEDGEMPDVDVEGGEMPEYDVDTADVEVGTEKKVVEVPEVDVEMPEDDDERDLDDN
ncbi:hypothetical protein OCL06_01210 [Alteromonas sp. ASW11-19]|uniref:Secreted protein n=1 Tax=Alteromonas salexigens TaxID=2982530 RepID=A0ABT2VLR4_9ALTE|nr:hypothetical protein [Alteromonas salexigens]MCU7553211.1 hypothetical protein [Alteromonas salexigens]